MRKSALLFVVMALSSSAFAADMPVIALAPVFTWTGFYVGVNAGGHWSTDLNADSFTAPGFSPGNVAGINGALPTSVSSQGFAGGAHVGYNWQESSVVFGAEADFDWLTGSKTQITDTDGAATGCGTPSCWVLADSAQDKWLGTVRARVGLAVYNVLMYATAGAAFANWSINHTFTDTTFGYVYPPVLPSTQVGWTVGGGLEYGITNNWLVRGEYLYADFGTVTNTTAASGGFGRTTILYQDRLKENIVRAGVSYKFN